MRALALTSSTAHAGIALGDGGQTWRRIHSTPRGHTEFMNVALEDLLKESGWRLEDVDVIAVDRGPGSFTGIRVAVNIARSLCYLLQKPAYVTESLDLLAAGARGPVVAGINAHKNLIFTALFQDGRRLSPSKVLPVDALEDWTRTLSGPNITFIGDAWTTFDQDWSSEFRARVIRDPAHSDAPTVDALLHQAFMTQNDWIQDWNLVTPLYLRDSAAEEALYGSTIVGRRIR